jgi:hypothetical protein
MKTILESKIMQNQKDPRRHFMSNMFRNYDVIKWYLPQIFDEKIFLQANITMTSAVTSTLRFTLFLFIFVVLFNISTIDLYQLTTVSSVCIENLLPVLGNN